MQRVLAAGAAVLLIISGGALAVASGGGSTEHGDAGHDQYHAKSGCGPAKSDGYAGQSGRHEGQPPKDHDRGDCPSPPGQQS